MDQVHKRFTAEQVKVLLRGYCQEILDRPAIEETLGISKSRFFVLPRGYPHNPDEFSLAYHRETPTRIPAWVEKEIEKELKLEKNLIELGYTLTSIIGLQVRMADLRNVADALSKSPKVCYLAFVTGRYDLMAIIVTRTHRELSDFIENEISAIPSILRSGTFVNLDVIKGKSSGIDTSQLISNLNTSLLKEEQKKG